MIARDALIQEAREKLAALTAQGEWREGLAGHYNVVAFDGDNVTGVAQAVGPHVRAFIIAAPRLIRDLLTLIDKEEGDLSRVDEGQPQACPPAGSTASGNEVVPSLLPDLCMPNPQCSCLRVQGRQVPSWTSGAFASFTRIPVTSVEALK